MPSRPQAAPERGSCCTASRAFWIAAATAGSRSADGRIGGAGDDLPYQMAPATAIAATIVLTRHTAMSQRLRLACFARPAGLERFLVAGLIMPEFSLSLSPRTNPVQT